MPLPPHASTYDIFPGYRKALLPLSKAPGWFDLAQLETQPLDKTIGRALLELSARRRQLIDDAQQFFSAQSTPQPRRMLAAPQDSGATLLSSLLQQPLSRHQGVVFGSRPPRAAGLRVMIELLSQPQGVTTLYLVGLLADLHQDDLDRYGATPSAAMPPTLNDYVDDYDRLRGHPAEHSLRRLLELARAQGIRLVALENAALRTVHSKQPLPTRTAVEIVNYYFAQRITAYQRRFRGARWLAWTDEMPLGRFEDVPGITELTDSIGVRLNFPASPGDRPLPALYLRRDRGEEVVDPAGQRCWLRGDLLLSPNPLIDLDALNARLARVDAFVLLARPDIGEFELRYRAGDQSILIVPLQRDPRSPHRFFIEQPNDVRPWGDIPLRRYRSVQALSDDLQRQLGMTNAWPGLTPILDTLASQHSPTRKAGWLHTPPPGIERVIPGQPLPSARTYELSGGAVALLLPHTRRGQGLDTRYSPYGLTPAETLAHQRFIHKRTQLLTDAEQYYRLARLPVRPAPPEIALAAPISDQLGQLLARYPGIVVGEVHAEHWGKQLLTEQMASLRDQGVRTLYLEQLITEQHQALLDKWHAAPDNAIPERLRSGLEAVDPEHQVGQDYTFIALVKAAHRHGVAVVPLDCFGAFYTHVLFNELQRIKLMNYYAMLRIRERQAAAPTDKWIALVGNAHANHFGSVPGIVELTGAVGLRVAGEPAGLLPDTGTWASSIELGQGFLKSDFVVSHRPVLTDGEINARLRAPGDFAIVYAPEPNRMAYELRYRDARRITVLPIRLTPNGLHFYLADTPWPAINHFQVLSLKTLNKMLEQIAKLHNVWPRLTPQPITTLSPEQRDLALHPAEAARQWQAAFEGLRQATLLRQLFFAPAQDQGEFKAGKAAWQAELAATPRFVEADLDTLKHIFVQQAPTATPRRLGALLAAVADRQARQADELAETWRAQIARLGGTAIRPLGHNRYLSATNHRQGVCAGLCAHMAAAWLQDAAAPGHAYLDAYLDNVEAATHAPDSDSARLLDLSLLAWSFGVPEAKFGTTSVASSAPLAGVIDQLERAGIPAVFKLSFGNHAMLLAKGGPATTRTFLLADPNFGYCKLSDRQALTNALDWHGQLVRRLLLPDETGDRIFTLRRYRADLPKQKLFPQVETGWLATQKLADLCALPARTAQFTTPLTQDATYRQLAWRLTLLEYRQTLQGLDPLNTTSRMLSDLLTRHQAPQSAVRAHARVLKIVFRRPNALITLAAPAGQVYPPLLIDGARYPQDIALLQKLVSLQQDLAPRGTLSFLSRWLRPRQAPVREIDRDVLSASLPDDAIERFLISSPARPF